MDHAFLRRDQTRGRTRASGAGARMTGCGVAAREVSHAARGRNDDNYRAQQEQAPSPEE